jgi:hypothetical protein
MLQLVTRQPPQGLKSRVLLLLLLLRVALLLRSRPRHRRRLLEQLNQAMKSELLEQGTIRVDVGGVEDPEEAGAERTS